MIKLMRFLVMAVAKLAESAFLTGPAGYKVRSRRTHPTNRRERASRLVDWAGNERHDLIATDSSPEAPTS
jgi:hypothetical protein